MREQFRQRGCSLNVFLAPCTQILYKKYKKYTIKLSLYLYCGDFAASCAVQRRQKTAVFSRASEPHRKKGPL